MPLSGGTQAVLRSVYGLLLLLTLLEALPQARRFFVSERWGGYAKSTRLVDLIQNPYLLPVVMVAWLSTAACLILGWSSLVAAFLNLLLCRYFFIHMRWKGILRGMGAPGFMTYWLGAAVFFLELTAAHTGTGALRELALTTFRADFALIMLSAGVYKALAGYPHNDGMELGMINPWWGYWGRYYARLDPGHWVFRVLNHLAYGTEIVAALLMLIPATQFLGALLIFASFVFIATHIRLGFLCEVVMACCLLFVPAGGVVDGWFVALDPRVTSAGATLPGPLSTGLSAFFVVYLVLLPFAHAGLYYNFLARRRLPGGLQGLLERWTNLFGIIIWRVFTVDVTNFFVNVYIRDRRSGEQKRYSRPGLLDWRSRFRYLHVGEFVCFASLFTTMKYYPSQWSLFVERLVRYARTIPCPLGSVVVFEYVSLRKLEGRFTDVVTAEYIVDPAVGRVEERVLDPSFSVRSAAPVSPVHEGLRPGSYAPASRASS